MPRPSRPSFTILDISRPIGRGELLYPGTPKSKVELLKTVRRDGYTSAVLHMGLHTGTHLDAPSHHLKNGKSIEAMHLESCLGWCRVIDARSWGSALTATKLKKEKIGSGDIILFKTKNSSTHRFRPRFAHLTEDAARMLVAVGIRAVGVDGPSVKKFRLRPDTVHPLLFRAGVGVYEGLNLAKVKAGRYFFIGMPLRIIGAESSPVRAVLIQ